MTHSFATAIASGLGLGLAALALPAAAQVSDRSSLGPLTAEIVADGLSHPWALQFLPDDRLLVTEREGNLRIVDNGVVGPPIEGVPAVVAEGQGGLLDLALAPDFAETGRLYLSYAATPDVAGLQRGTGTAVMAATLEMEGDGGRLVDQEVIFRMNNFNVSNRHFGSRIVVDEQGDLFVTLGERGDMDRAQDPQDLAGAVVHIAADGSIPDSNPDIAGWAPELWSIGHRNPQGATLGPDGALYTAEHGAMGGDEINRPEPGSNYGWPTITYGVDYSGLPIGVGTEREGLEQPLHYWDPSISPSGLDFIEGELFAEWDGDLITGGLSGRTLVRVEMEDGVVVDTERLFAGQLGRVRDVRLGPDGAIYAVIDAPSAPIYRITPAAS